MAAAGVARLLRRLRAPAAAAAAAARRGLVVPGAAYGPPTPRHALRQTPVHALPPPRLATARPSGTRAYTTAAAVPEEVQAARDDGSAAPATLWLPVLDAAVDRSDVAGTMAVLERLVQDAPETTVAFAVRRPLFSDHVAPAFALAYVQALLAPQHAVPLPPKLLADVFRVVRGAVLACEVAALVDAAAAATDRYQMDAIDVHAALWYEQRHRRHCMCSAGLAERKAVVRPCAHIAPSVR